MLQLWITYYYYYYNYYLCKQLYCVPNAEMFLNVASSTFSFVLFWEWGEGKENVLENELCWPEKDW